MKKSLQTGLLLIAVFLGCAVLVFLAIQVCGFFAFATPLWLPALLLGMVLHFPGMILDQVLTDYPGIFLDVKYGVPAILGQGLSSFFWASVMTFWMYRRMWRDENS